MGDVDTIRGFQNGGKAFLAGVIRESRMKEVAFKLGFERSQWL